MCIHFFGTLCIYRVMKHVDSHHLVDLLALCYVIWECIWILWIFISWFRSPNVLKFRWLRTQTPGLCSAQPKCNCWPAYVTMHWYPVFTVIIYCPLLLPVQFLGVYAKLCLSVLLSIGMEQLSCHWMDFHEILYLSVFQNSVQIIQVLLKVNDNNGFFT